MSVSDVSKAALALRRFGLGPRPGDLATFAVDPQAALLDELAHPAAVRLDGPDLLSSNAAYARNRDAEEQRRVNRLMAAASNTTVPPDPGVEDAIYKAEAGGRFTPMSTSPNGLQERLGPFLSQPFFVAPPTRKKG